MSSPNLFIYFNNFGVRYTLLIFYFVLFVMIFIYITNKKKYKIKFTFRKPYTVKIVLAYALLIPFFWWKYLSNNQNNILTSVCKSLLSIELIFIAIFVFLLIYGVIIYINKDVYFNALILPISVFLYLDIFSVIVTSEIDFLKWYNIILFLIFGFLIWTLNNIKFERIINNGNSNHATWYYSPIEKIDDLFEERKWQATYLMNLINEHLSNEPISICISGKWGNGKTSFINAVINEIKKDSKTQHKIIQINAMDMDSIETLFKYLFKRIRYELEKENFYVGISSEYQNYISSLVEIISKAKIKSNIISDIIGREKDYREAKEYFQEMLNKMIDNNKLIIVVDDIERCSTDKVIPFINFIKEIATFKNCVVIFLSDYEQLRNALGNKPIIYLDKFFNYRINLVKVNYDAIIKHIININNFCFKLSHNMKLSVLNEVGKLISQTEEKISHLEESKKNYRISNDKDKDKQIEKIDSNIKLLNDIILFTKDVLSNPRNVTKFLIYINEKCKVVYKEFLNKNRSNEEIEKYLINVEATKNITILSFIQVALQEKYDEIQVSGFKNYLEFLCDKFSNKEFKDEVIICYTEQTWYKNSFNNRSIDDYKHIEVIRFITSLLKNPSDLNKIINGFSSYDEKYINMIDNEKYDEADIDLIKMFDIVVLNFAYQKSEFGAELIDKLFAQISRQVKLNKITNDDVFNIIISNRGFTTYYSPKLKILQLFYEHFCNDISMIKNAEEIKRQLNLFCRNYIPGSIKQCTKIFKYHFADNDDAIDQLNDAINKASDGRNFYEVLNIFCETIKKYFKSNEKINTELLKSFLMECKEDLKDMKYLEMDDINNDMNEAFLQVNEYEYLEKIINFIDNQAVYSEDLDLKNITIDNVEKKIDYLIKKLKNDTNSNFQIQSYEMMDEFFRSIKQLNQNKAFSNELITKLNRLICAFKDFNKTDVGYYRMIMLRIQKINNSKK